MPDVDSIERHPAFRFYLRRAHRQIGLGSARASRTGELLENGPDWARTSDSTDV
jgi:hypothetical protein